MSVILENSLKVFRIYAVSGTKKSISFQGIKGNDKFLDVTGLYHKLFQFSTPFCGVKNIILLCI